MYTNFIIVGSWPFTHQDAGQSGTQEATGPGGTHEAKSYESGSHSIEPMSGITKHYFSKLLSGHICTN